MDISSVSISSGQIDSTEGLPIRYDLYTPISRNGLSFPVILFLHGFKGFKDWGPFPDVCEEMARAGFGVVAMNFSLNGIGDNKTEFTELELFERETISQDLDDIGSIIDALQNGEITDNHSNLNTDVIGLIGHSRGGHTAITAAVEYAPVQCLVTCSAVADYRDRWTDSMKKDWKDNGYTEIENSRTGQKMKVGKVVYDDYINNSERVNAYERVKELRIPTLFIHGRKDETVPATDSEKLHIECDARDKELRLVANGTHTYGTAHPFEDQDFPKPFAEVLDWTEGWFVEHIG
ncbi:alpha/beta hydrolase family protein [Gracilimonas sp.]|uniref:alpha/beta hydrolase family protein n=1 Tax=Gracilimonas sp. TaxID=1974203 RepID=UPI0028728050|nr:alpha/beta hydrolase [Gracilimonas sp.]